MTDFVQTDVVDATFRTGSEPAALSTTLAPHFVAPGANEQPRPITTTVLSGLRVSGIQTISGGWRSGRRARLGPGHSGGSIPPPSDPF